MSLARQFLLSVVAALMLGLSLLALVACWHARRSVENEMGMALAASDRIVDNALASLPGAGTDAYLARLVRSFDGNRHVRLLLLDKDRVLAASRLAAPDPVPGWYQRLLEIPTDVHSTTRPRLKGRALRVVTDARNEIGEAWVQFRDGAAILALFSLLMLALLHLAMRRIAGPLRRLGSGFEAVGGGDYGAQVPAAGPREIAALAAAFNRMTERLRVLEDANRRLGGQMLAIQEEERADLARDLHDEMGPFLFAMRVDAEAIEKSADGTVRARARAITEAVSHIQSQVRNILKQLRPDGLAETGLTVAIANLVTFWRRHHDGIAIHLDMGAAADGFGAEVDGVIYRLVQEGLTNAARHGAARQVWIAIRSGRDAIRVTVEDDGTGLVHGGEYHAGLGLRGMRERLAALSGSLSLAARGGGGTRLTADIPRARAPEAAA